MKPSTEKIISASFLSGVIVGIAAGISITRSYQQKKKISPNAILTTAKKVFAENGNISGSWIQHKPEPYRHHGIQTSIYRGGIVHQEANSSTQYEFIADANTGSILAIYPIVG